VATAANASAPRSTRLAAAKQGQAHRADASRRAVGVEHQQFRAVDEQEGQGEAHQSEAEGGEAARDHLGLGDRACRVGGERHWWRDHRHHAEIEDEEMRPQRHDTEAGERGADQSGHQQVADR